MSEKTKGGFALAFSVRNHLQMRDGMHRTGCDPGLCETANDPGWHLDASRRPLPCRSCLPPASARGITQNVGPKFVCNACAPPPALDGSMVTRRFASPCLQAVLGLWKNIGITRFTFFFAFEHVLNFHFCSIFLFSCPCLYPFYNQCKIFTSNIDVFIITSRASRTSFITPHHSFPFIKHPFCLRRRLEMIFSRVYCKMNLRERILQEINFEPVLVIDK